MSYIPFEFTNKNGTRVTVNMEHVIAISENSDDNATIMTVDTDLRWTTLNKYCDVVLAAESCARKEVDS